MPIVVQLAGANELFCRVFPGANLTFGLGLDGFAYTGQSFGASANTPLLFDYRQSTPQLDGFDSIPYTLPYYDLNQPVPGPISTTIGADASFIPASWNNEVVSGTLYGTNAQGEVTYPGDLTFDSGPYTFKLSDLEFSNATDQTAYVNAGGGVFLPIVPVRSGFLVCPSNYGGSVGGQGGPIVLFVDPLWKTYRRLTIVGSASDPLAQYWCNRFFQFCGAASFPKISAMYDGSSYWFSYGGDLVFGGGAMGAFPLMQVPFNSPGGYFPYPIVAPNSIRIRVSGGRALGPSILGTCCMTDDNGQLSSLPIFPTASGVR